MSDGFQTIEYFQDEEHILRRLGGAVIVLWDTLDKGTRERVLDQAMQMSDRTLVAELGREITDFIGRHQPDGHASL